MEEKHQIGEIMGVTMDKIKEMIDVNTIVGEPIRTPDGITIIPVSKVSMGFASGGSDFVSKNQSGGKNPLRRDCQPIGIRRSWTRLQI